MTEPKERSVTLSWTPGDDHNSPVIGTVTVFWFFFVYAIHSLCKQLIFDTCLLFEILIDFSPL